MADASLIEARIATSEKRWRDAFAAFEASDADDLKPHDLTQFALAAQLIGNDDTAAAMWERAHLQHLADGDIDAAVDCAFWLAFGLLNAGRMAQASGWFARSHRLAEEHELDGVQRGFLLAPVGLRTLESGDPAGALEVFHTMHAIGKRFDNPDLIGLANMAQGRARVILGELDAGLALLDEAMVSVTAGEVSPMIAGRIYCAVILVCHQAFDIDRAREWTAALSDWCDTQQDIVPFRGQCLIHRSQVKQWQGDWAGALVEAERARSHLSDPPGQPAFGMAFCQLGDILRMRGEFDEAIGAYREASQHGKEPMPGLALVRHLQGDSAAAAQDIRRALDAPMDRGSRVQTLRAAAEILAASGDVAAAGEAANELTDMAQALNAPVLRAAAAMADTHVALAAGDSSAALAAAQSAASAWAHLKSPYEHARARVLAATACAHLGDDAGTAYWAEPAATTFASLGAEPDFSALRLLQPTSGGDGNSPLTARQLEVLAAVASGRTNAEIADQLFVSEHTVRRHLQNIYTAIDVTSRAAATAYAYEHDLL